MKIMDVRVKRVCKVSNKSQEGLYWRDTLTGHQRRKLALEAGFDPDLVREMCRGGDFVYAPFLPEQEMKGAYRKTCKKRAGKQTRKLGQCEVKSQLCQASLDATMDANEDQRDQDLREAERELDLALASEYAFESEWWDHIADKREQYFRAQAQLETA